MKVAKGVKKGVAEGRLGGRIDWEMKEGGFL